MSAANGCGADSIPENDAVAWQTFLRPKGFGVHAARHVAMSRASGGLLN